MDDVVGVDPALLAQVVVTVREAVGDDTITAVFERSMRENLAAVSEILPDGTTFVLTGDIPAMWLRDSGAQVRPYLILAADDPALQDVLLGVLRRQLEFIALDPYANSFKRNDDPSWHADDLAELRPQVWERKYEIDSLCFPLELAYRLWRLTGRDDVIDERFRAAAEATLGVWTTELDHTRSAYAFQRLNAPLTDTLSHDGRGGPVGVTGMTWAGFRPSDDACEYHYNVPGNMFAVVTLGYVAEIAQVVFDDADLAQRAAALAQTIRAGIEEFGRVEHPEHGSVYAYEVDGLGSQLVMDDANMPSLLSMPLSGYLAADDPTYLATRALLLSEDNPYYYVGTAARGIGSPHTPKRYIWPIGLAVQGLTSTDPAEKRRLLDVLRDTTGGTGLMHEGFDVDDPTQYTRPWFSWANAMFCELVLEVAGHTLENPVRRLPTS